MSDIGTGTPTARQAQVAGELRVAVSRLSRRLREQSGGGDLTKSQLSVLGRLERDGAATVTELANAEGIRSQSMGAIVAALDEAGLVSGSPHPRDGRKTVIDLTVTAKDLFATGRLAKDDWLTRRLAETLTEAELEQVAGVVTLLSRIARA